MRLGKTFEPAPLVLYFKSQVSVIWLVDKVNGGNLKYGDFVMDNDIEFELAVMDSDTDSEESKSAAEWLAFNKLQIFPLLKSAGIALVTVEYRGCGASGQIDDEDGVLATGPEAGGEPITEFPWMKRMRPPVVALPEAKVTLRAPSLHGGNATEQTLSLREAIEHLCWALLGSAAERWDSDEGEAPSRST
jgi:hypothetical protein